MYQKKKSRDGQPLFLQKQFFALFCKTSHCIYECSHSKHCSTYLTVVVGSLNLLSWHIYRAPDGFIFAGLMWYSEYFIAFLDWRNTGSIHSY